MPREPRLTAAAAAAVAALLVAAAPATAGFGEGSPEIRVTMEGPAGPIAKGSAATYTVGVVNDGSGASDATSLELSSYRVGAERPVPNPYAGYATSQGQCARVGYPSRFGEYHTLSCDLGTLAPGASATVTATVEVNESMDHHALVSGAENDAEVTTLVDAPPEVSGSSKIKVRGLPPGCARDDFELVARSRGAKKLVASLRGPLTADGKPPAGEVVRSRKLGSSRGERLRAQVGADSLDPGFHEVKLAAKYDGRPKRRASILLQSC